MPQLAGHPAADDHGPSASGEARWGAGRELMPTIWVVAPSYCDVPAFEVVRKRTTEILADHRDLASYRPRFVLIDDSAGLDPEVAGLDLRDDTRVLQVPFNLGHQRALVFGVRVLSPEMAADDVVVTLD